MKPKPWIESVHLHPDVLKENAETDIFALDLGPLSGDRQHRRWRDDYPGRAAGSGCRTHHAQAGIPKARAPGAGLARFRQKRAP